MEGDNPVDCVGEGGQPFLPAISWRGADKLVVDSKSRVVWECSPKIRGGKFHPKLNTGERPIAHKYREGKMQRTLKRELKVLEIVKREAIEAPPFLKRLWRNSAYLFQWFLSWPWIERGDHNFWKGGWRGQLFFFFLSGRVVSCDLVRD